MMEYNQKYFIVVQNMNIYNTRQMKRAIRNKIKADWNGLKLIKTEYYYDYILRLRLYEPISHFSVSISVLSKE